MSKQDIEKVILNVNLKGGKGREQTILRKGSEYVHPFHPIIKDELSIENNRNITVVYKEQEQRSRRSKNNQSHESSNPNAMVPEKEETENKV